MQKIIIFGTEQRAIETYIILQSLSEYMVVGFSDNNKLKWGTKKFGLDIIPPRNIYYKYKDAIIVIASADYVNIGIQLIKDNIASLGQYLESVNQIIGNLSISERVKLKNTISMDIQYYNLDYKTMKSLKEDNNKKIEKYLVICNNGYSKDNNPRHAFVHRRVCKYLENGIQTEVFGYIENTSFNEYRYEEVNVYEGGLLELQELLLCRNYKKILIHFIDQRIMYCIWKSGKINLPIIVWCHGYEVMPWTRTWFNYSEKDIAQYKNIWNAQDKKRSEFLKNIFKVHNMHFVFVSNYLKNRVKKFVGELPINCSVIPNFIDCEFYNLPDKVQKDRMHILSIKNHKVKTYANDLTAKAILELAEKDFFSELTFDLYGDGVLFENNFGELQKHNYSNVHIHKNFLNQEQMREVFKQNGIFLSPTRMDSHQVTSSEAMSAGMAVITCNLGPIHEFMDEECASFFEGENYFMMAEEIEYLYYHPEEFLKKCQNAKIRVQKQCGYRNTIQKEIALILKE